MTDFAETKMAKRLAEWVEVGANIGVVAVCLLLVLRAVGGGERLDERRSPELAVKVGQKLEITEVNWRSTRSTLILAFRKDCGFCLESVPFYERLSRAAAAKDIQVVVLVSEPVSGAAELLKSEGVHFDMARSIRTASPPLLKTPMILLVDAEGVIQKIWPGKLPETTEPTVVAAINGE
jgi:hypothetical protein